MLSVKRSNSNNLVLQMYISTLINETANKLESSGLMVRNIKWGTIDLLRKPGKGWAAEDLHGEAPIFLTSC